MSFEGYVPSVISFDKDIISFTSCLGDVNEPVYSISKYQLNTCGVDA